MTDAEILAAFDEERRTLAPAKGATIERAEGTVRNLPADGGDGWILWSGHAPGEIDAAITAEITRWRELGRGFEGKVYAHDQPADLRERLAARGFEIGDEEAWMLREAAGSNGAASERDVTVRRAETAEDLADYFAVAEAMWPGEIVERQKRESASWDLRDGARSFFVARVDGRPAAIGRLDCPNGGRFAGLIGGSTLPEHRRRGLYTALVQARAADAAARGRKFLWVDSLPTSRPRLEALGFRRLSATWPCTWRTADPPRRKKVFPPRREPLASRTVNQLEEYILQSAEGLTMEEVEEAVRDIPMIRAELATVELPKHFPHLPVQTELLCRFVEDVFGGQLSREEAGPAFLEAVFAVRYFHKPIDVIPDHLPRIGKLDDALVVQTVIHRHATVFRAFSKQSGLPWEDVRPIADVRSEK